MAKPIKDLDATINMSLDRRFWVLTSKIEKGLPIDRDFTISVEIAHHHGDDLTHHWFYVHHDHGTTTEVLTDEDYENRISQIIAHEGEEEAKRWANSTQVWREKMMRNVFGYGLDHHRELLELWHSLRRLVEFENTDN